MVKLVWIPTQRQASIHTCYLWLRTLPGGWLSQVERKVPESTVLRLQFKAKTEPTYKQNIFNYMVLKYHKNQGKQFLETIWFTQL